MHKPCSNCRSMTITIAQMNRWSRRSCDLGTFKIHDTKVVNSHMPAFQTEQSCSWSAHCIHDVTSLSRNVCNFTLTRLPLRSPLAIDTGTAINAYRCDLCCLSVEWCSISLHTVYLGFQRLWFWIKRNVFFADLHISVRQKVASWTMNMM